MKFVYLCVGVFLLSLLASCESPRALELSIPLKQTQAARPDKTPEDISLSVVSINPLDVLVAVETVAADNGLKPWVDPLDNDDLLGLADDAAYDSAVQTWRHPEYPVYLSATRHKGEILLLLNWPSDANADAKARKLFMAVKAQLTKQMSPFLNPVPQEPTE